MLTGLSERSKYCMKRLLSCIKIYILTTIINYNYQIEGRKTLIKFYYEMFST